MRIWYIEKSRVHKPKEVKVRSMNWNFRMVAAVLKKKEVKEAQGILSTDGRIKFGTFQAGLNYVLEKMGEDEKEELKDIAIKWNSEGPPAEEKQRLSEKWAMKFCWTFAEKAWKQFGGRVYIFWGSWDTNGSLTVSKFDFNAEFGRGTSYRDIAHEGPMTDVTWGKYLQQCYDVEENPCTLPSPA
ncbi:uncharacterized protein LACBIDRAFT_316713 [Laccaria bicolor S238N-H82]|uniref:Predicted protein n=1 Tax=Laccaria bicolor (strain S238N-H82 / ATCC MYA-4686) TaxID=486041 RepID=B0E1H3_LACBS|nr:uncharacterized protein LACBIDRAFT_316713 [Laccaria bicolor S238N-H82]EDQ99327.1 predicted protein [Laccaria bicolor S238N-H82]|eukprot:XP_001890047.1 predicted protein [Laccaria bicolor S238N-H82]